jgi:hypothetical protein
MGTNRRPTREQVDRLTLVDRWRYFVLDQPTFAHPGDVLWVEDGRLQVQRRDGRVDAYPGFTNR